MKIKIKRPKGSSPYSDFTLLGIPIGGAAGDKVKEEQRAREEQNRLNADTIRIQQERERIENENRIKIAEQEAKLREVEALMALENVKAKNLELELRKAEALQKIEFQKQMGEAAADRAVKLNEIEAQQGSKQVDLMDNKLYLIVGGVLIFIVLLFFLLKN